MRKSTNNVFDLVVKKDLCTGCSFCTLCPHDAVKMIIDHKGFAIPVLSRHNCTDCGLCLDLCPGAGLNLHSWSQVVINPQAYDPLLGGYADLYIGYCNKKHIRSKASSGGIATSLLLHMMEAGYIDGAIVSVMSREEPLIAEAIVATSKKEVVTAAGSKYTSLTLDKALKQLMTTKSKYAFVGLPCQIEALRLAEKQLDELSEAIFLIIGLYCGHLPSMRATEYLLYLHGVSPRDVVKVEYRVGGWPGWMLVETRNGRKVELPFEEYWKSGFGQAFMRKRCLLCADHSAELADISLSDPWELESIMPKQVGLTVIIARTKRGTEILEEAQQAGVISLKKIDRTATQSATLSKKRNRLSRSVEVLLGVKALPRNFEYPLPLNFHTVLWLLMCRINIFLASYKGLWPLLLATRRTYATTSQVIHSVLSKLQALIYRIKSEIGS